MTELFRRACEVIVGSNRLRGHHVTFRVKRTLRPEPNTCEVTVANLSPSTRASIESLDAVRVRIRAGYGDELATIYDGELREVSTTRDGPTITTTIRSGDGERAYRRSRVNRSFAPGSSVEDVMGHLAESMRTGIGNALSAVRDRGLAGIVDVFESGTVVSGRAADELTRVLDAGNLEWSVQGGALQVLERGAALQTEALRLSSSTGLLGSPSVDAKGELRFRAMMIPGIAPGVRVVIDSEFHRGTYRIETAEFVGDTSGGEWAVECTGRVPR